MNVYLTHNENYNSNNELVEGYPELYFVYFYLLGFLILATLPIVICLFPIQCGIALTILIMISKLIIIRKHLTFFHKGYDLDIYPEEFYKQQSKG